MLTPAGYQCWEAIGGLNALALLEAREKFDLIVTDLVNDGLGGIGLLERANERFPDIPVVLMTTVRRIGYALEAVRNGAYDYLLKPFEREQLLAFVRRALEYRHLKLENRAYQEKLGTLTIATTHKPELILVQDDEETIREIVCSMLTLAHYECRTVASPKEVLDILRSGEEFELLFCGLLESLEEKLFERMAEEFPDVPVVVASACHDISLFLPALRKGAYDYLQKPFERSQLLFCLRRALEYRRLKLENRAYSFL